MFFHYEANETDGANDTIYWEKTLCKYNKRVWSTTKNVKSFPHSSHDKVILQRRPFFQTTDQNILKMFFHSVCNKVNQKYIIIEPCFYLSPKTRKEPFMEIVDMVVYFVFCKVGQNCFFVRSAS